jgi:anti-anti-sigma factor
VRTDDAQTPSGPASLAVRVDLTTGRLTMTGRLDGRTAHLLYDAVSALLRAEQPSWTVDVAGLDVADHAGLHAIVGAYRRAVRHHRRMTLHGASPALKHALTRLRLDRHLLPRADQPVPADSAPG